jgi:hypothetical protein
MGGQDLFHASRGNVHLAALDLSGNHEVVKELFLRSPLSVLCRWCFFGVLYVGVMMLNI